MKPDHRSTALADWRSLFRVRGVTFYSLQVGNSRHQLKPYKKHIRDLAQYLTDWAETAAALTQLDLLITCDTGIAHLAGALGIAVWVALPADAEWRWMLDERTTPWYPTARLYRQSKCGDWSDVFAEMARDLAALVEERTGSVTAQEHLT